MNNYQLTTMKIPPTASAKREAVEKAIRDSIPNDESRELKFGCKLEGRYFHGTEDYANTPFIVTVGRISDDTVYFSEGGQEPIEIISEYIILGRDLHLEDVLIALQKKEWKECHWFVDSKGNFYSWEEGLHKKKYMRPPYNLSHSASWNLQNNQELVDFLFPLLCE